VAFTLCGYGTCIPPHPLDPFRLPAVILALQLQMMPPVPKGGGFGTYKLGK
jgi:hypothetical protein